MGEAIGAVLPIAIAVAIFPVPIIAAVLIVGSPHGRAKGLAYALAWCGGLAAVGAGVLLVTSPADPGDASARAGWMDALLLTLGVALLVLAWDQWRRRPRAGDDAPMPGWMRTIDELTVVRAGAVGFALSALNPKNAMLAVAAASEIAGFGLPASSQVAVLLVFVLLASAGVLAPVAVALVLGDRSREPLAGVRTWMARHTAAIMAALFVVIGAKLIGDAIAGLSS